jgi:hypothetical protein
MRIQPVIPGFPSDLRALRTYGRGEGWVTIPFLTTGRVSDRPFADRPPVADTAFPAHEEYASRTSIAPLPDSVYLLTRAGGRIQAERRAVRVRAR